MAIDFFFFLSKGKDEAKRIIKEFMEQYPMVTTEAIMKDFSSS